MGAGNKLESGGVNRNGDSPPANGTSDGRIGGAVSVDGPFRAGDGRMRLRADHRLTHERHKLRGELVKGAVVQGLDGEPESLERRRTGNKLNGNDH